MIKFNFSSKLKCSICQWVSESKSNDVSLKLPLGDLPHVRLSDLISTNLTALHAGDDAVFCGNCRTKTPQMSERCYNNPDLFLIEVIRVKQSTTGNRWIKNDAPISFDVKDLKLPGFLRPYSIVGSCHHRGSLNGGHWITKISTSKGWFDMDDLRRDPLPCDPPGIDDASVSVILLVSTDKLGSLASP
jgi:ubiquitin C-terminal hydrolase